MESLFDLDAPKKATNLSVNSDLLKKSKALNINLSGVSIVQLASNYEIYLIANYQKEVFDGRCKNPGGEKSPDRR